MKTITELEVEINEALSCQEVNTEKYVSDRSKVINTLKDVLGLIDKRIKACKENQVLFPKEKAKYEEFEQRLEELKARING